MFATLLVAVFLYTYLEVALYDETNLAGDAAFTNSLQTQKALTTIEESGPASMPMNRSRSS